MPECYLDTNLVEVLLQRVNSVNHKKRNSNIAGKLNEIKKRDEFAVAIVDDDKQKLKVLAECREIEKVSRVNLKLYEHINYKHYFIQISPAIEKWILDESGKCGLDLGEYNLPSDLKKMKKLKSPAQRNDVRFAQLFKDMLASDGSDTINELQRWLVFFRDNNFKANIDLL